MVGRTFNLAIAEILFGIKLMRFRHSAGVIAFHYRCRQRFGSSLIFILWHLVLVFSKTHKCSMGFRSRDWVVHSRSSVQLSLNHIIVRADLWHGALSCKSRTPSMLVSAKSVVNEGINDDSSTSMYFVEFVRSHRQTIGLLLNQSCSQTIMLQPPCFTVCTTHSGLNASPTRRRIKVTPGVPNICDIEKSIKLRKKSKILSNYSIFKSIYKILLR